ncbi:MAG: hypothetical protein AB7O26_21120 [Planctomycetaceae bacterium]
MSSVIVLTPVIVTNWGTISAAITAAVAAAGFARARSREVRSTGSARLREMFTLEESRILESDFPAAERTVMERDGIRATFSKDVRGALKLCIEADGLSRAELQRLGNELIGRVTQQYVYHRLVTELKRRNMSVIHEEIEHNQTVRIRVRSR